MVDLLLAITIFSILFSIGLSINKDDFKLVFSDKKALLFGLAFQLIGLPILVLVMIPIFNLPPEWAMGFFLVAISPGGTMSNFISYILKGDVVLSVALTGINSIITVITIPLLTQWGMQHFMFENIENSLMLGTEIIKLLSLLFVPLILGFGIKNILKNEKLIPLRALKIFNSLLLGFVYLLKLSGFGDASNAGLQLNEIILLLPFALVFHFSSMLLSYFGARFIQINSKQSATIGLEVGLQNTTLALLISAVFLANNNIGKPALIYAMFSFFTTFVFAYISLNKRK